MTLGSIIRVIRAAKELSQAELAEFAGCSQTYLSQVENGKREPSLQFLSTIANVLGIPRSVFFLGDNCSDRKEISDIQDALMRLLAAIVVKANESKDIAMKDKHGEGIET